MTAATRCPRTSCARSAGGPKCASTRDWRGRCAGIGRTAGGGSRSARAPTVSTTSASTADGSAPEAAGAGGRGASRGAPGSVGRSDRTAPEASAGLAALEREIVRCRRCPRLVAWREQVAHVRRAAFSDWEYWGRPVPGFGDPAAAVLVLGLAPAAHGGNRTGRVFTGDRSGDWLFAALHRAGFANQPRSLHRGDGLRLTGAYVAAAVRCAPPANRPTPAERDRCLPFLVREMSLLAQARTLVCLGAFAWDAALRALAALGHPALPRPRFAHLAEATVGPYYLLGSYHPSQQNTFTGKLTEPMFDAVFARARELAGV